MGPASCERVQPCDNHAEETEEWLDLVLVLMEMAML